MLEALTASVGTTTTNHRHRRRHHFLLFFVLFLPRPPPLHPFVSHWRNMAPRQEIQSVHTLLALSEQPPRPVFSDTPLLAPDTSLPPHFAPFLPLDVPEPPPFPPPSLSFLPPRCILNQSLGGNAITRHHDASTIFYFKLLYVLVPLPCSTTSPARPTPLGFSSSTARSVVPPGSPLVTALSRALRQCPPTVFLPRVSQRCSSLSRVLSHVLPWPPPPSSRRPLPHRPDCRHPPQH